MNPLSRILAALFPSPPRNLGTIPQQRPKPKQPEPEYVGLDDDEWLAEMRDLSIAEAYQVRLFSVALEAACCVESVLAAVDVVKGRQA